MLVDLPEEKERERMLQSSCHCFVTNTKKFCLEILGLHLRDARLDGDVSLGDIARKARYYSCSDLKS